MRRPGGPAPRPVVRPVLPAGGWVRLGFFGFFGVVVFGRAFQLQVLKRDFLIQEGEKRHIRTLVIPAHRGAIRDRRGEPLALSAPVETIWVVPAALLESSQHLYAVAKLLNKNPRELESFLRERKERKFVYISDPRSPADAHRGRSRKAPGVFSEPTSAR